MRINKKPAINTASSDFHNNWKTILSKAEKDLVQLLLVESDKIIAKIDFEIHSHIKEYHPNNYHHERDLLQKKHSSYKKELSKRRNKKWKKFKEKQISEGKKLESKVELTKSLSDNSLSSSIIEKEEFSTSKGTERKESTDIVLERGLENDFHHTRFNSLAKNVTDNRAFRKSKSKQQREVYIDKGKETDSDKKLLTYADRVEKPTEQVVDLSQICSDLLAGENGSSKMVTSPPNLCTNSAHISNDSGSPNGEKNEPFFCTQDKEILSILEELEQVQSTSITGSDRISGYFCSDTVFNLSKKFLSDMEIKILEKGLDYAPIQNKINEPELRRLNWYFRNEPTPSFSERPSFTPKSSWKPPKGMTPA